MKAWETKALGEVCQFRGGGTPSKAVDRYWQGTIPWVSPKDMKSQIVSDSIDHISQEAIQSSATALLPAGSVLMVVRSGILARTVPIAIAGCDLTINQDLKALCPSGAVLTRFLYHLLDSRMDELLSMVSQGATVHRLMTEQIRSMEIVLPPLPEQRRIVGILDEAFEGIATARANAERNLQNARALFESHLQSVFSQRGEGWVEKALGEFATFRNGINFTKSSRGEKVKIVGVKDFQQSFWAPLDGLATVTTDGALPESDLLKENDILFVRSNGNMELIGRCLLIGSVTDKITHSGFTIRARLNGGGVSARYLCHFLKSRLARRKMIDSGIGTNIKSLNQTTLSALAIPVPSIAEQETVVDLLESVDVEIRRLASIYERKLAALEALKKSLLDQAFTGRL